VTWLGAIAVQLGATYLLGGKMTEATGGNLSEPNSEFPKEALITIPLIGSALAFTFDIGYFWGIDINLFTLFSVTEHVLFAMEALPLAVTFAAIVTFLFGSSPGKKVLGLISPSPKMTWVDWLIFATIPIPLVVAIWVGSAAMFAAFAAGICTGILHKSSPSRNTVILCVGFMVFFVAWAIGFDLGRQYLRSENVKHSIQVDSQVLSVKIIRSGDKGVLYYEPKEKELAFVRWEAIKKISETR
jgi:hypothetical protein